MHGRQLLQDNQSERTAKELVKVYLEAISDMERAGIVSKPDWARIWTNPDSSSRILRTYRYEIEKSLVSDFAEVNSAATLEWAAGRTAHHHSSEVSSAEYCIGIMPGSFDPIHLGHVVTAFGSIHQSELKLNGVVMAAGGDVPDKAEIASFRHRSRMIWSCIHLKLDPWITFTPIRHEIVRMLRNSSCFGNDPYKKRSLTDIAAFHLLFAMNPKVAWVYVTGSDKVNKYGTANERDLVEKTLAKRRVSVLFLERDSEPIDLHSIFSRSWLRNLWDKGMFRKLDISYKGTSAAHIRDLIVDQNPVIEEELDTGVLNYVRSHHLDDLYRFNRDVKRGVINRGTPEYDETMARFIEMNIID
jgi:nicotinic acid mononucleotide adenylyltransferase